MSVVASAAELHAQSVRETEHGRHAAARRLLRAALRSGPDSELRARILISLAYHQAERRSLDEGLLLLGEADEVPDLPQRLRGMVAAQRGLLYMRAGRSAEALAALDAAVGLLDESEPEDICRPLLNRGILHMQRGTLAAARADFRRCADVAGRHGLGMLAAKASHNLGYLFLLSGALPRALREMDVVRSTLSSQSPMYAAVYHIDRAQVLLAAGLWREADEDLAHAVDLFRGAKAPQDQAESELARAQVALLEERYVEARRLAERAGRRFASRGADAWALLARHVAVAAAVGRGRGAAAAADDAVRLATALAAAGLDDEARRARLTGVAALLAIRPQGSVERARDLAGPAIRLRRDDPIATRLQARAVRAGLADAEGDPRRADAELRAALADLHRYQASFGSLDLQTAVSGHGRRLAEDGLARALATGRPATVFGWAERARALSTRLPPVVPPADPEAAALLEELRRLRVELRMAALAGQPAPALRSRCAQLERLIRQRSWYTPGPGQTVAPAPLADVQDQLAVADATYVAHLLSGGRLHALVAGAGRRAVLDLGPAAPAVELLHRVRADLDALATINLPEPVRVSVRAASRRSLQGLDELLWHPLRRHLADGPLLLAPSAGLVAVPWTLLPALRGRPLAVVASATAWLAARDRAALPARPTLALAAGPRVARAEEEVRLVAEVWSAQSPTESTTAGVREAVRTADVLHVAAHGVHEPDNPLFSHLELADGPLFGHELHQLPQLPAHIVLSACELGLARPRPGEETLGMTAALLHGGAGSVVAGVARIADAVAYQVGPAHHAALREGQSPAAALAAAIESAAKAEEDLAPLVCFGAGW
ncbi:CHAT domain-containing protein [Phytohabitans kaempferiae]|uniref:CHAT domain-containing protein n=1 Tax=Phytohabitans kaempferiae TaxID=1620943 RepID=A0ABV6M7Y4_9ACTN